MSVYDPSPEGALRELRMWATSKYRMSTSDFEIALAAHDKGMQDELDEALATLNRVRSLAAAWKYRGEVIGHLWSGPAARALLESLSGAPDPSPDCNGICATAADVGLAEFGPAIAQADPSCPLHGTGEPNE